MPNSIYSNLSRISFLKRSYAAKFLFVAFLGTHIPLLGLIFWILSFPNQPSIEQVVIAVLGFTLIATAVTLITLKKLLAPVKISTNALEDYCKERKLPELPSGFEDEAGQLMTMLQQSLITLNRHITEKEDLAALMSHNLRSPFAQMMGIFEIIKLEEDREKITTYCNQMIAEGRKSLSFLERTLIELKESQMAPLDINLLSEINLQTLIDDTIASFAETARRKGVIITSTGNFKNNIIGDKTLILSALNNLVSNAIKFSLPKGVVRIETNIRKKEVLISVSDKGVGISEKEKFRLFKRFVKGQKGTQGEESTGFGLYSAQKALLIHGGKIEAFSEGPGKGSTFTITIPTS